MDLAGIAATILATLLKAIFGTDKPQEWEVIHETPDTDLAIASDADLLDDLGL